VLQLDKLARESLQAAKHDQLPSHDEDLGKCSNDILQHCSINPDDWEDTGELLDVPMETLQPGVQAAFPMLSSSDSEVSL